MSSAREVVLDLVQRFGSGDVDAVGALLADDFVSHNPRVVHLDPSVTSGRQAFIDYLGGPIGDELVNGTVEAARIISDADHVVVHSRLATRDGQELAVVDIFRVRDGLVSEHWDVVQQVPKTPSNQHGMF
ncbi:MAG TPA: nuclear transport factor 2 family protein [Kribbella sp.]|nr:nuclear transport factor 2 family protein [Kribbella sp.]